MSSHFPQARVIVPKDASCEGFEPLSYHKQLVPGTVELLLGLTLSSCDGAEGLGLLQLLKEQRVGQKEKTNQLQRASDMSTCRVDSTLKVKATNYENRDASVTYQTPAGPRVNVFSKIGLQVPLQINLGNPVITTHTSELGPSAKPMGDYCITSCMILVGVGVGEC
ncbi:hypothetical protein H1C71_011621 [Ictidomys tridecemlineatus]|nr:hypothetical protein H1C71_011621 [Ictidomys tridecemlineatus]